MGKIIAISGTEDTAKSVLWTGVIGLTFLIFVGTLLIRGDKKAES